MCAESSTAGTVHCGRLDCDVFRRLHCDVLPSISDLAAVWWKEYAYPVRAALSIAMLYRNLAKARNMIPHVCSPPTTHSGVSSSYQHCLFCFSRLCFTSTLFVPNADIVLVSGLWRTGQGHCGEKRRVFRDTRDASAEFLLRTRLFPCPLGTFSPHPVCSVCALCAGIVP